MGVYKSGGKNHSFVDISRSKNKGISLKIGLQFLYCSMGKDTYSDILELIYTMLIGYFEI